jgi:hypothetical protein
MIGDAQAQKTVRIRGHRDWWGAGRLEGLQAKQDDSKITNKNAKTKSRWVSERVSFVHGVSVDMSCHRFATAAS